MPPTRPVRPLAVVMTLVVTGTLASCAVSVQRPAAQSATRPPAPACPDRVTPVDERHGATGPDDQMVPGRPVSATVCRYAGLNDPDPSGAYRLLAHAVVTGDRLQPLTTGLSDGRPHVAGPTSCPADDGRQWFVRFAYEGGTSLDVVVHGSGCTAVSNGARSTRLSDGGRQALEGAVAG